jgi:hypothetical protein
MSGGVSSESREAGSREFLTVGDTAMLNPCAELMLSGVRTLAEKFCSGQADYATFLELLLDQLTQGTTYERRSDLQRYLELYSRRLLDSDTSPTSGGKTQKKNAC